MGNGSQNEFKRNHFRRQKLNNSIILSSKDIENAPYKLKIGRKLLHLVSSLLGFFLFFFPEYTFFMSIALGLSTVLSLFLDTLRLLFKGFNEFLFKYGNNFFIKRDEQRFSSGIFYLVGCLIVTLLFPPAIAGVGIITLGIGDTFASIGGSLLKKWLPFKMPFTHKTYAGFVSFVLTSFIVLRLLGIDPLISLGVVLAGALVEVYSNLVDDNISIPIVSSTVMYLLLK